MDFGIIQSFKIYYHKSLLRYVLAKIDECSKASDIVKSVSILNAVRWVAQAWESVSSETIKKCFRKAGATGEDFSVVTREECDPFCDLDVEAQNERELESLVHQILPEEESCYVEEYIDGDFTLPVCFENDENWEDEFFAGLCHSDVCTETEELEDEEDLEIDVDAPPLKEIE